MVMDKETEQKLIVGVSVGVGCLVAVTVLVVVLLVIRRRIQDKKEENTEPEHFQRDQSSSSPHAIKVPYPDPYRPSLNFSEGQRSRPPVHGPGQVPFRDTRLPSSNVYFTYDGRLHKPELPMNEEHAAPFDALPNQNDPMGQRGWPYDMYNYQRHSGEGRKAVSEIALHQPKGELHYHQHQISDRPPPLPPPREPKQTLPEIRATEYQQFLAWNSRLGNKAPDRFMEWTTGIDIGEEAYSSDRKNERTTIQAGNKGIGEYTTYTYRTQRNSDPHDKHFVIKRQDSNISNPAYIMGEDNYAAGYDTSIRYDSYTADYETTIRQNYVGGSSSTNNNVGYDRATGQNSYRGDDDVFERHDSYTGNDDVFARHESYMDGNGPSSRNANYTGETSSAMRLNSLKNNDDVFARHTSYGGTANGPVRNDIYTGSSAVVVNNNSYTGSVDVHARQNSYTGNNVSPVHNINTGNRNNAVNGQHSFPGSSGISFVPHNHTNGRNILLGRHPTDTDMLRQTEESPSENSEYDSKPIWPMWQGQGRDTRPRISGGDGDGIEETRWNQITRRWMEDYDYEKCGKLPRVTATVSSRDDTWQRAE